MSTLKNSKLRSCFVIALFILIIDQLSKQWVMATFMLNKPVIIVSHLNFILAYNKGAAFGLLSNYPGWQRWLFIAVALVISVIILVWSSRLKNKDRWEGFGLACILGGALGNLFDRICYGHVVDFIDFYIETWHWYTFNIADIAICIGAFVLLCLSFKKRS